MQRNLMFAILLCLCAFVACKQEESSHTDTAEAQETPAVTAESETQSQNNPSGENPNLVANMPWTFLTHQLFHHRVTVASGKVNPDEKKGNWIDFKEDGTYDYGVWDQKTYSGKWTYDDNKRILHLMPSNGEKQSEWTVMNRDDNVVMIGTATYGDNPYQVQWIRHAERPDKNAKSEEYEEE